MIMWFWATANSSAGVGHRCTGFKKVKELDGPAGWRKLTSTSSLSTRVRNTNASHNFFHIHRWCSQLFLVLVASLEDLLFLRLKMSMRSSIISPKEGVVLSPREICMKQIVSAASGLSCNSNFSDSMSDVCTYLNSTDVMASFAHS